MGFLDALFKSLPVEAQEKAKETMDRLGPVQPSDLASAIKAVIAAEKFSDTKVWHEFSTRHSVSLGFIAIVEATCKETPSLQLAYPELLQLIKTTAALAIVQWEDQELGDPRCLNCSHEQSSHNSDFRGTKVSACVNGCDCEEFSAKSQQESIEDGYPRIQRYPA